MDDSQTTVCNQKVTTSGNSKFLTIRFETKEAQIEKQDVTGQGRATIPKGRRNKEDRTTKLHTTEWHITTPNELMLKRIEDGGSL